MTKAPNAARTTNAFLAPKAQLLTTFCATFSLWGPIALGWTVIATGVWACFVLATLVRIIFFEHDAYDMINEDQILAFKSEALNPAPKSIWKRVVQKISIIIDHLPGLSVYPITQLYASLLTLIARGKPREAVRLHADWPMIIFVPVFIAIGLTGLSMGAANWLLWGNIWMPWLLGAGLLSWLSLFTIHSKGASTA